MIEWDITNKEKDHKSPCRKVPLNKVIEQEIKEMREELRHEN